MLYDNFQRYSDDCKIENVSKIMNQIDSGHYAKLEKEKYDNTLLQLVARKRARTEKSNLQKSEQFLKILAQNESIHPIIDKKIYIEIIEEGSGEPISSTDTISLHMKQSDESGKMIKDTTLSKPTTISIAKMMKGFKIGIEGAKIGEKRKIYIHPSYGMTASRSPLFSNHVLIYEVEILSKIK
jgi:FKBP-type peptidyl-prolyl cis-trans isomerase